MNAYEDAKATVAAIEGTAADTADARLAIAAIYFDTIREQLADTPTIPRRTTPPIGHRP